MTAFPELHAELCAAPKGINIAIAGQLADWDVATRMWAESQMRSTEELVASDDRPWNADRLRARLNEALDTWRSSASASCVGARAAQWIEDSVTRAAAALEGSALPDTLVNGAFAGTTTHRHGSQLQISEWRPSYRAHAFTSLASMLNVRMGLSARISQRRLAAPYIQAWVRWLPEYRLGTLASAGVIVGGALNFIHSWQAWLHAGSAVRTMIEPTMAAWCEVILRYSTN